MSGQTIADRLNAARHSIAGQGVAKAVCKATTEEVIGPKKKHLDYLLHCTNEPNVSIPQLANLLVERTQNASWVVVFKALVTVHHIMCYGNERFTQYLASSNSSFQLSTFLDKSGVPGYDMSTYIRRYSKYLNEKAISYRTVAFDFCKVKRGKEDGTLRTMAAEKLLKTLPSLQNQLDALLEFDCTANELTNGVINMAFMLLFRDLIRLFACYNDGIINLLEKYFDMNKKQCRDALDIYKKFLIRMDRVAEFLKVAENVGIEKGDIPDLTKAPSSLLDALEQHLASLEGKKIGPSTSNKANFRSAVSALSSTSSAFISASSGGVGGRLDGAVTNGSTTNIDENLKLKVLADEEAAMAALKEMHQKTTNPFLSSPEGNGPAAAATAPQTGSEPILDLFGSTTAPPPMASQPVQPSKASEDLLQLGNPFADIITANSAPAPAPAHPPLPTVNLFGAVNGSASVANSQQSFTSDASFSAVFGGPAAPSAGQGFDAFGDVLQPTSSVAPPTHMAGVPSGGPPTVAAAPSASQPNKLIGSDLDSSLASLVQNLDIGKGPAGNNKNMQWGSPKVATKTGGNNWQPQVSAGTTRLPMGMASGAPPASYAAPTIPGAFPQPAMQAGVPPMGYVRPMGPGIGGPGMMTGAPIFPPQNQPSQATTAASAGGGAFDPFGAL